MIKIKKNIPLVDCDSHTVHSGNCSARNADDDYRTDYDYADTPKADNSTGACHNRMSMVHAYDSNRRYCNRISIARSDNLETNVRTLNMQRGGGGKKVYICLRIQK